MKEENEESVKTEKKKTETTYKNVQNFGFHLLRRRFFSLASLSLLVSFCSLA
tara:strand:+ start:92 stop:247 length:156 start_codon:yes stop_codon:yes gene_type:complete